MSDFVDNKAVEREEPEEKPEEEGEFDGLPEDEPEASDSGDSSGSDGSSDEEEVRERLMKFDFGSGLRSLSSLDTLIYYSVCCSSRILYAEINFWSLYCRM